MQVIETRKVYKIGSWQLNMGVCHARMGNREGTEDDLEMGRRGVKGEG